MRVAIDNSPLVSGHAVRGVGVYTKELIKALGDSVEAVDFSLVDLGKYDVIHYPYFSLYQRTLPLYKSTKMVVTIHDLIPLIYPKHYPPGIKGMINFFFQKMAVRNADAIITDTQTSKKDIVRLLGIDPDKVHVIYLAPQTIVKSKSSQKIKLPERFVLYVGDVNYNKNLLNLAKACKLAKIKLVMVGKQTVVEEVDDNIENRPWREFLKLYKNDSDIIRLGFVEDLDEVFKKATLYCQPSFYEGFGLPLLEAFQRNIPVVASRTQALVEVGDNACLYFDPYSPEDIAQKLKEVMKSKSLRSRLIKSGKERLKHFSWEKCARETKEVYAKI